MSENFLPRSWQTECLIRVQDAFVAGKDFLVVATPGGGKTKLGLAFAQMLIRRKLITHVHVITPTTALRLHWNREARAFGIQLVRRKNNSLRNLNLPIDVGGVAATYHQVASDADAHAANIENSDDKALVILDECHHIGDQLAWGEAIKLAFEGARFRLHLSGTPFRNDGNVIPWIKFDTSGVAMATGDVGYTYSYLRAMEEDVCRPIAFKYRNINLDYYAHGKDWNVDFTADLDSDGESARLRHALSIGSGLVEDMVRQADLNISEIRSRGGRFTDIAGILVAMNQSHAYECAEIVARVTGETPAVIVSDSDTADDDLEAFSNGCGRWVIAVRKISEGVDIPRLMVAVYATNIVSTLFFRQFVGRVVRVRHRGAREMASVYMPADQRLMEQAREIETEVKQFIRDKEHTRPEIVRALHESHGTAPIALRRAELKDNGVIIGGYFFTPAEILDAGKFRHTQIEPEQYTDEQIGLKLARLRDEHNINVGYVGGKKIEARAA